MNKKVCIIGGGVTGMQVANVLASLGFSSILIEKTSKLGGKVSKLSRTFPFFSEDGFNDGKEFTDVLESDLTANARAEVYLNTELTHLSGEFPNFEITLSSGDSYNVGAIVVTTGFETYNPVEIKEYGYKIYPNVITALELEWMLNKRGPTGGKLIRPDNNKKAERLAIVFCVGSRNRRIDAPFCSRICCSYSTKQAITVIDRNPNALVACFYIDIRTYDRGFEEMYSLAQDKGIKYIRGRVASCKQQPDGSILVRAENTLIGKPFWGEFDIVSLSTGMRPCKDIEHLGSILGIQRSPDGFFLCHKWFKYPHDTTKKGIFVAGCATGMKPIRNCIIDGSAVAARIASILPY